jgi:hypothetical protein
MKLSAGLLIFQIFFRKLEAAGESIGRTRTVFYLFFSLNTCFLTFKSYHYIYTLAGSDLTTHSSSAASGDGAT